MQLKEVIRKVNTIIGCSISLGFYSTDGRIRFINAGLDDLCETWAKGKRHTCTYPIPKDSDFIYGVIIGFCNGTSYIVDCGPSGTLTFGDLMNAVCEKFHITRETDRQV